MIEQIGQQARAASRVLARSTGDARRSALHEMASAVVEAEREILAANSADMDQAVVEGISGALIDRLRLTSPRVEAMAAGLRTVAALPDPVGQETGGWVMHNGIRLHRERVPLGVVAVIYEAGPMSQPTLPGSASSPATPSSSEARPTPSVRTGPCARCCAPRLGGPGSPRTGCNSWRTPPERARRL